MRTQNTYYKYIHILLYVIACTFVILFSFFIFSSTTYALHSPTTPGYLFPYSGLSGEDVCRQGGSLDGASNSLPDRGSPPGSLGPVVPIIGIMGGIHVPVKDFEAEAQLRSIAKNIRIIAQNSIAIERDTNLIEKDTQAIRYYLRSLCDKEFSLDHTIQQQWMEAMGKLQRRVVNWITSAYTGNPVFVNNPHVYYRNVDLGVTEAMKLDIWDSKIDGDLKLILMRKLENTEVELLFPDYIAERFSAGNKAIFYDDDLFTWDAWIEGTMLTENNLYDLSNLVEQEVEERRLQARAVEQEKLAWGRGFFPWEVCGQEVFSERPEDIRTCKTLTPGALIQDLSSLVLGTVIRQIENSDEYEEWISNKTFSGFNAVFYAGGLGSRLVDNTVINPAQAAGSNPSIDGGELRDIYEEDIKIRANKINGLMPKAKIGVYFNDLPLDPVF